MQKCSVFMLWQEGASEIETIIKIGQAHRFLVSKIGTVPLQVSDGRWIVYFFFFLLFFSISFGGKKRSIEAVVRAVCEIIIRSF